MSRKDYPDQVCSVARALEVVGERRTLLILRDVLAGLHRFDNLVDSLGITRNVLTSRLRKLVEDGVLERRRHQRNPAGLFPVIAHLMHRAIATTPKPLDRHARFATAAAAATSAPRWCARSADTSPARARSSRSTAPARPGRPACAEL